MGGYGGEIVVTGASFGPHHRPYVVRSLPPPAPSPFHSRSDLDFRGNGKGGGGATARRGPSSAWCFGDPEADRRRRVAGYKAYSAEGRAKSKARRGWRWLKKRCRLLVHGY